MSGSVPGSAGAVAGAVIEGVAAVLGSDADGAGERRYRFEAGPYVADEFAVEAFDGREALSTLYRFEVTVAATGVDQSTLEPALLGQPASLDMGRGDEAPRTVHGVVTALQYAGTLDDPTVLRLRLRVEPRAALLKRNRTSKIFQDLSVPEIVAAVLGEAGVRFEPRLTLKYQRRTYCVQYRESDWEFVQRLLAEEGIYYFFEQPAGLLSELTGGVSSAVGAAASAVSAVAGGVVGAVADEVADALEASELLVLGDMVEGYAPLASTGAEAPGTVVDAAEQAASDVLATEVANARGTVLELSNVALAALAAVQSVLPGASLRFRPADRALGAADHVTALELRRTVRSKSVLLRDYDFVHPKRAVSAAAPRVTSALASAATTAVRGAAGALATGGASTGGVPGLPLAIDPKTMRVYEHHGEDQALRVSRRDADTFLEQLRARTFRATGASYCKRLAPGFRFELREHPVEPLNQEYVLRAVRHRGRTPELFAQGTARGADLEVSYENTFEAAPATQLLRPARPRRRPAQTLETAVVVGPAGEEVYTDQYGRIKVQFHWDLEGEHNERSSCWLRAAQAWAGQGFGQQFVPRVGMEVLVSFLGGDPDRPTVVACLHNGDNLPPFALPGDKTRSGIRTQSSPGGDGYNELSFEDARGAERVDLRAERTLATSVVHTHEARVGMKTALNELAEGFLIEDVATDRTEHVGRDRRTQVDRDMSVHVARALRTSVDGDHVLQVRGKNQARIDGDEARSVRGSLREEVDTHRSESTRGARVMNVGHDLRISTGGDLRTSVRGGARTSISGNDHRVVTGEGATSLGANYALSAGQSIRLEALDAVRISCGESSIELTRTGVVIEGPELVFKGTTAASVQAPDVSLALRDGGINAHAKQAIEARSDLEVALESKDAALTVRGDSSVVEADASTVTLNGKSSLLELGSDAVLIGATVKLNPKTASVTSTSADATPEEKLTSWVDVCFEDDVGEPVAGARFVVEMSNGEKLTGVLNGQGCARVRVLPGATKITFPDYDASAWK